MDAIEAAKQVEICKMRLDHLGMVNQADTIDARAEQRLAMDRATIAYEQAVHDYRKVLRSEQAKRAGY